MTKQEFLISLRRALSGLPQDEVDERVSFYAEMIDDRVEEGFSEEEAIERIDDVRGIASKTLVEVPLGKIVRERIKPKRALSRKETLLLVLGFPLWFPLLVAIGALILSCYVVLFSLFLAFWAVDLSAAAGALGGVGLAGVYLFHGLNLPALAMLGIGVFAAGLSIGWFFLSVAASKGIFYLCKMMLIGVKRAFVKKERAK